MTDPVTSDPASAPADAGAHTTTGSHGGRPGDRTADLHHNQDTAVRQSGDQPPESTASATATG